MHLINCEVSLTLTWSQHYVLNRITTQAAVAAQGNNPARPVINVPINAAFKTTDRKLYVSVVILSTENHKKLLEQSRTGFERTIKWNNYRLEMTKQTKNNNLNYSIDRIFTKVKRLFVLTFENKNDRTSFSKFYLLNIQMKNFNVLIDGKNLFDMPIKMTKKHTNKLLKWEETMITWQVIYWTINTFQSIAD